MKALLQVWKDNLSFTVPFAISFITGAVLLFFIDKGDVVLWANTLHGDFADEVFRYWTKGGEVIAYSLVVIVFLLRKVRWAVFVPLVGGAVGVMSYILKMIFKRDRPGAFFTESGVFEELLKVVDVHINMASTSFPSGHTMSGVALFTYAAFCIKKPVGKFICFVIAFGVAFSRMYLIQHFLEDLIFGSIIGFLLGSLIYLLQRRWKPKNDRLFDRSILKYFEFRRKDTPKV